MKSIQDITQRELQLDIKEESSWHKQYKGSAYVFIGTSHNWLLTNYVLLGGLNFELTEGDILSVFSQ